MSSNSRDQAMQNTQMLQEFMELVQIPVNSKQERQICDVLKKKFSDLGFSVTEDGTAGKVGGTSGNLIAVLREILIYLLFSFQLTWTEWVIQGISLRLSMKIQD